MNYFLRAVNTVKQLSHEYSEDYNIASSEYHRGLRDGAKSAYESLYKTYKSWKYRYTKYGDNLVLQDKARDILLLYIGAKLGYSPIRHIVGLPTDKLIENVVRQHLLGRNSVDGDDGELFCPNSKELDEFAAYLVSKIAKKWDTINDPYVDAMLHTNTWYDDPVVATPKTVCKVCGFDYGDSEFIFCPKCGNKV